MNLEELRAISITDLLSHIGHHPTFKAKGGNQWFYHSPLRKDDDPSFCVSKDKNLWYDFGLGKGGNVIDLAMLLNAGCSFSVVADWLESQSCGFGQIAQSVDITQDESGSPEKDPVIENVRVGILENRILLSYLQSRGIPEDIGRRYCKEVHYNVREHKYFALCFQNILGGMEIRNRFFKGGYGTKAPSVIHLSKEKRTKTCCLFEGFMDFLSYKVLRAQHDMKVIHPVPSDCIVLNSTSLVKKALPFLQVYEMVFSYLDNDVAGRQAAETIEASMPGKVMRISDLYSDYKDLNDYLMSIQGNN